MGPCPVPGGGSRKPPTLIHPEALDVSAGTLPVAGPSAARTPVAQTATPAPNATAAVPYNALRNATRLKRSIDANVDIGTFLAAAGANLDRPRPECRLMGCPAQEAPASKPRRRRRFFALRPSAPRRCPRPCRCQV